MAPASIFEVTFAQKIFFGMKQVYAVHPDDYKSYGTEAIRNNFLLDPVFERGKINFVYTHYDRMIVGGAMPTDTELELPNFPILRADYFLERREMGIINVGGDGVVTATAKNSLFPNSTVCTWEKKHRRYVSLPLMHLSLQYSIFYLHLHTQNTQ